MAATLLIFVILIGIIGAIIFFFKKIGENYLQIWNIIATYIVILFLIKQVTIILMDINVKELMLDMTIGIWFFNISIESLIVYFTLPFLVMNIYYGYIKSE